MKIGILFDTIEAFETRNAELSQAYSEAYPDDGLFEKYSTPTPHKNGFWMEIAFPDLHTSQEIQNAVQYEPPEEETEITIQFNEEGNDYEIGG